MTWEEANDRLRDYILRVDSPSPIAAMAYAQEFEIRLPPPNDVYLLSDGVVVFEWHRDDETIQRVFIDGNKAEQMTSTISGITKFELLKECELRERQRLAEENAEIMAIVRESRKEVSDDR